MTEQLDSTRPRQEAITEETRAHRMGAAFVRLINQQKENAARLTAAATLGGLGAVMGPMVHPAEVNVAGIDMEITPNFSGDDQLKTNLGNATFEMSDWPVGVTVEPQANLAVIERAFTQKEDYVKAIVSSLEEQKGDLSKQILMTSGAGALLGGLMGACAPEILSAMRRRKMAMVAVPVGAALGVAAQAGGFYSGYNEDWATKGPSNLSHALADFRAAPDMLDDLSRNNDKINARIHSFNGVIAASQEDTPLATERQTEQEYINVLSISDIHLRYDAYSYLEGYVEKNNVDLILNLGDEANWGLPEEITDEHLDAIRRITEKGTIMLFVMGNHDSPELAERLETVPGVYALDSEVAEVYGLKVAGFRDPFEYLKGGMAVGQESEEYRREVAKKKLSDAVKPTDIDIVMSHSPDAMNVYADWANTKRTLETPLVQLSGHTHKHNPVDSIVGDHGINLAEASTGANGIFNYSERGNRLGFSHLRIDKADCRPEDVQRFSLPDPLSEPGREEPAKSASYARFDFELKPAEEISRRCDTLDSSVEIYDIPKQSSLAFDSDNPSNRMDRPHPSVVQD